jgi:hypothetical protein
MVCSQYAGASYNLVETFNTNQACDTSRAMMPPYVLSACCKAKYVLVELYHLMDQVNLLDRAFQNLQTG